MLLLTESIQTNIVTIHRWTLGSPPSLEDRRRSEGASHP
jgi:hypothetical protein